MKKTNITDYINGYTDILNTLSFCQKLFPDAEATIDKSKITIYSKQVNLTTSNLHFEKRELLGTYSSGVECKFIHEASPFESFILEEKNVIVYGTPLIPLFIHSEECQHLYFLNYLDIISKYYTNNKILINKCNSYIIEFISKIIYENKSINTTYLPEHLRKLLIFM